MSENLTNNFIGFILSLISSIYLLSRLELITLRLIDSTLEPFKENAKKRKKITKSFILIFGTLLLIASTIFLYKTIKELLGQPVSW